MICIIDRPEGKLFINPDRITSIVDTEDRSTGFPVTIYMADGSWFALTKDEMEQIHFAWKFRDKQCDKLIELSEIIIKNLEELNGTAHHMDGDLHSIDSRAAQIVNNTGSIASNSGEILTETRQSRTLL